MEARGDWSMPSFPCAVEATPEAETKKDEHGTSLARKRLEYTSSRARPLKWGLGPKVKPGKHMASPPSGQSWVKLREMQVGNSGWRRTGD